MTSARTKAIDAAMRAAELEARIAAAARDDDARFAEFTLSSERTGQPLVIEDGHHDALAAIERHQNIVIMAAPKTGKTTIITYARTLRRIGLDPVKYRAKFWSVTKTNATRHTLKVRSHIESNRKVQLVFPSLAKGAKWTEDEFTVDRGAESFGVTFPKEPTLWACGMEPSNQGFRSDEDIFDDVIDPQVSASRYQCEKLAELIMDNVSRVEADGKRIFLQNCFRRWDTGFILAEKYGWHLHLMPAIDRYDRTLYPVIWPQKDCDSYSPARKDQDLRCVPKKEGDSCFQEAYLHKGMMLGVDRTTVPFVDPRSLRPGAFVITACDPAGGKKKKQSDLTALVTLLVEPAAYWGMANLGHNVRVVSILNVVSGKFSGPEIRAQVIDHHARYGSIVLVEDVATQDWMRQMLAVDAPHVPVAPFPTNAATKHHQDLGFESMASRFSLGLIVIPSRRDEQGVLRVEPEIGRLLEELRSYDPETHTGDRSMALWMADVAARTMNVSHHAAGSIDLSNTSQVNLVPGRAFGPLTDRLRELGAAQAPSNPSQSAIDEEVRRRFGL